jgi:ABC-type enterobactin transport system permease subunit
MAAGNALLASCGLGVGEMQQAVQQQLLAPGSVCAALVVEALQQGLQELQRHRVHQVMQIEAIHLPNLSAYCACW